MVQVREVARSLRGPGAWHSLCLVRQATMPTSMENDARSTDDWDVDQLFAFAEEVFGNKEKSLEWMRLEIVALRNARPIDLMSTPEGRTQVRDVLDKIQEGFP